MGTHHAARSGVAVTRVAPFLCRRLFARESNARGQIRANSAGALSEKDEKEERREERAFRASPADAAALRRAAAGAPREAERE